jgi:glycosyltransferase involved in cell wall biosynthesis
VENISVLNISSGDLIGSRFNGFDWHYDLEAFGVNSKMLVGWNHESKEDWIDSIADRRPGSFRRAQDRVIFQSGLKLGDESLSYPWASRIFDHPWYKQADVIHLQIVHDGTLDFKSIDRVIQEKPTVWTWHDPWPMTGHCIYPMDCSRWVEGCGECPDLLRPFKIEVDRTKEIRLKKMKLIQNDYVLHVASQWFADFIALDQYAIAPNPIVLPFGLKSDWAGIADKHNSRRFFSIPEDNFVIGLRSVDEPQKNIELVKSALRHLSNDTNITVLTIQNTGRFTEFRENFQVVEIPWTNDPDLLANFFSAMDLFIMPSLWETYGFMAVEAMSFGIPVAGLDGTATSEVCDLARNGFIVQENTGQSLAETISLAIDDKDNLKRLGALGLKFVKENRNYSKFLNNLTQLYVKAIKDF